VPDKDWILRTADASDVNALALVGAATFLESFAGILESSAIILHCQNEHNVTAYQRYFTSGAAAWLAEAKIGGAPVGFGLLSKPDLPSAQEGDLELKRIYTLSRYHGSGMGSAIMDAAVVFAIEKGAKRLLLGVYRHNARALAFYAKQGFVQIGTRIFQVGDRQYDDVVLAKQLCD
jgi:diamine N-acetyltransferase